MRHEFHVICDTSGPRRREKLANTGQTWLRPPEFDYSPRGAPVLAPGVAPPGAPMTDSIEDAQPPPPDPRECWHSAPTGAIRANPKPIPPLERQPLWPPPEATSGRYLRGIRCLRRQDTATLSANRKSRFRDGPQKHGILPTPGVAPDVETRHFGSPRQRKSRVLSAERVEVCMFC